MRKRQESVRSLRHHLRPLIACREELACRSLRTLEGVVSAPAALHLVRRRNLGRVEDVVEGCFQNREELFGFQAQGQRVLIEFVKRLRPMVAYTGVEALIEQINDDVVQTREVLAEDAKNYCPPECPVQAEVKQPGL